MTGDIWETFIENFEGVKVCDKPYLPDFLIISPPRTASTWLHTNLCCHPDIFIPEKKEIHYFDRYFRVANFQWYLNHFKNTGKRYKGEATPSYSILPLQMIKLVKSMMPRLKLIFIMREPVGRTWSEVKLNQRLEMGPFAINPNYMKWKLDGFSRQQLLELVTFEWYLAHSDYVGSLKRWLSVFPPDQIYLGFYETLSKSPQIILEEIFGFLCVPKISDWTGFQIHEKINQSSKYNIPAEIADFTRSVFSKKTHELAQFLNDQFHITLPCEWEKGLKETPESKEDIGHALFDSLGIFQKGYNDKDLKNILNTNFPLDLPIN